jgi:mRNA interferase MazF
VKADVVIVNYPYADLSQTKRRPALVVAEIPGTTDVILCQITTQFKRDADTISLTTDDFAEGSLPSLSNVRPNRLITLSETLVIRRAGRLTPERMQVVTDTIIDIMRR